MKPESPWLSSIARTMPIYDTDAAASSRRMLSFRLDYSSRITSAVFFLSWALESPPKLPEYQLNMCKPMAVLVLNLEGPNHEQYASTKLPET